MGVLAIQTVVGVAGLPLTQFKRPLTRGKPVQLEKCPSLANDGDKNVSLGSFLLLYIVYCRIKVSSCNFPTKCHQTLCSLPHIRN